ncbi:MAG: riboflavin biosynthesis protein RibF [Opitutales bacterium]|nr:riboflavin biosynthesis protein RibF [Opitutales bacterium]
MKSRTVNIDDIRAFEKPCVLAVGMFDGLHLGHRRVLEKAAEIARARGAAVAVLTFSPHPSRVVDMGRPPVDMLYGREVRAKMFRDSGAQIVFVKKFDKRFAAKSAEAFGAFLEKKFPKLAGIVTGENFVYGKNAEGDARALAETSERRGWIYSAVKGVYLRGGERMSSSLMRRALSAGDLRLYSRVAGRPYFAEGEIARGKKIGRKLGFPTLNLPWNPECRPPFGVYAVRLEHGKREYWGVANYGVNPTVGKTSPVLETNLFENVRFGAGSRVKVSFLKFLRPEKKFETFELLKKQIAADKKRAAKFCASFEKKINKK